VGIEPAIAVEYALYGLSIATPGLIIVQEMRQIAADHNQSLIPAPEHLQNLGHLPWSSIAHHQWNQGEIAQGLLQKGQLHFKRMLPGMSRITHHDLRQMADQFESLQVQRHIAQRR